MVVSEVHIEETDLHIQAAKDVTKEARHLVVQYRLQLEKYIRDHPLFLSSLRPLPMDSFSPAIVQDMLGAADNAGVGPMAAVAGCLASFVGRGLLDGGVDEIIVENGGDIFIHRKKESTVAVYAGESPMSYKVGICLLPEQMPCGVCTSSGTIGHSLSLGQADSVTVVASSVSLADAAATRLGNEVGDTSGGKEGVRRSLEVAKEIEGIDGVLVICNDVLGAFGDISLIKLE